jgi:hypothetical protein
MRVSLAKLLSWTFVVLLSCDSATAAQRSFYSQCQELLPVADDFSRECQQRARPFSRTFYPGGGKAGEVESYSTYFKALDAPSNFVLGCVLDFKNKINFAGLFYSASSLDMTHFNDYQIAFIDPSDNVGLQIDGVRHTLLAVRQFVTDVIPARLRGRPKNCEDPHIETFGDANATALEHFHRIDERQMEYCYGRSCQTQRYSVLGIHEVPVVYNFIDLVLIDGNGVLMLKDDYFKRACATWKGDTTSVYNIIYEACKKAN